MRVLSIDPGYERLGIAIVEKKKGKDILLYSECFKTDAKLEMTHRLFLIGQKIEKIISKWKPEILAIETLFFNTNQKTAMRVAEARGIIIYEGLRAGLSIREFTPLQVKLAITSYGRGDKKQMIAMIPKLILIEKKIEHDDEYDAIGIGITCLAYERTNI